MRSEITPTAYGEKERLSTVKTACVTDAAHAGDVMRGKLLAQAKTIHRRGIELGEVPQRRRNEIDLFHIGTTVYAGREMQAEPDLGQDRKAVVQIFGGSIREITASQSAVDPL